MNKRINFFINQFKNYKDQYILIGGSACDLIMDKIGLTFRMTKDIDIIVTVMSGNNDFLNTLKDFIKNGEYSNSNSDDRKIFYRFSNPKHEKYPKIIELFSKRELNIPKEIIVNKINKKAKHSDFSAIMFSPEYYDLANDNIYAIENVRIPTPLALIILKLKAWDNLRRDVLLGKQVKKSDIPKHKNDIFRLWQLLDEKNEIRVSKTVLNEINGIIDLLKKEDVNLKQLKIDDSKDEILDSIQNKIKLKEEKETN